MAHAWRTAGGWSLFACRALLLSTQAHVIHEAMERSVIKREEAVVVASVTLTDGGQAASIIPAGVDASELAELVSSSLNWTGLAKYDVLMVQLPASPSSFSPLTHLPSLVHQLEGEVAKGVIGSYGFSCSAFTAVDDDAYDADVADAKQPVRKLFAVVESVKDDHSLSCISYEYGCCVLASASASPLCPRRPPTPLVHVTIVSPMCCSQLQPRLTVAA
jgi:hypothetical protein